MSMFALFRMTFHLKVFLKYFVIFCFFFICYKYSTACSRLLANQRDIKLITDKFAITEGITTRQTANVSVGVIINCQRRLREPFYI